MDISRIEHLMVIQIKESRRGQRFRVHIRIIRSHIFCDHTQVLSEGIRHSTRGIIRDPEAGNIGIRIIGERDFLPTAPGYQKKERRRAEQGRAPVKIFSFFICTFHATPDLLCQVI